MDPNFCQVHGVLPKGALLPLNSVYHEYTSHSYHISGPLSSPISTIPWPNPLPHHVLGVLSSFPLYNRRRVFPSGCYTHHIMAASCRWPMRQSSDPCPSTISHTGGKYSLGGGMGKPSGFVFRHATMGSWPLSA